MKWNKPEFYTEPGPSGPEGIKTQSRILRAGTFAEGCRGIPRKRGGGGGATMGGDAHRSPPPAAFWFLFRRGKRNSPKGRNPVRRRAESSRPTDVMVYGQRADLGSAPTSAVQAKYSKTGGRAGQETRPYGGSGGSQQNRENGRGKPLPYGTVGKHSAPEDVQKTQHPAGLLRKKGMAGLNYHKMYNNVRLLTSAHHRWGVFLKEGIHGEHFSLN